MPSSSTSFAAVTGPMPGTFISRSDVEVRGSALYPQSHAGVYRSESRRKEEKKQETEKHKNKKISATQQMLFEFTEFTGGEYLVDLRSNLLPDPRQPHGVFTGLYGRGMILQKAMNLHVQEQNLA